MPLEGDYTRKYRNNGSWHVFLPFLPSIRGSIAAPLDDIVCR